MLGYDSTNQLGDGAGEMAALFPVIAAVPAAHAETCMGKCKDPDQARKEAERRAIQTGTASKPPRTSARRVRIRAGIRKA